MRSLTSAEGEALSRDLTDLQALSISDLRARWRTMSGAEPPGFGRTLLIRALAYRMQEKLRGGLKPALRRRLLQVRAGPAVPIEVPSGLPPGSVLIREWQGVSHSITVIDQGAVYNGRRYRSLTEVARTITGTHQSGPKFFGLRSKRVARGG